MINNQKQNNGIYQFGGDFYVKLPNNTVWSLEDNMSLRKKLNCSFLCATLFKLYEGTNMINVTSFSIEELMVSCGYTSDKRMIKKFKELLLQLNKLNVISNLSKDIIKAKADTYIKCRLNLKLDSQYFMIYAQQYKGIFNSDYDVKLKNNAFTFFCYIVSRMKTYNENKTYQYTFFSLKTASEDLGLSISALQNCIRVLKNCLRMNIDHIGYVGSQKQNTNNIYAFDYESLIYGLKQSYEYFSTFEGFKCKEEYENIMSDKVIDKLYPKPSEEEAPKIKETVEEPIYDYSYEPYGEPIEEEPIEEEYESLEEEITEVVGEAVNYVMNGMDFSILA